MANFFDAFLIDKLFVLGMMAGTLTTIAFFPQLMKVLKTKSTHDISAGMFIIFTSGVVLWLIYGLIKNDAPIIISNAVTLTLSSTILALKFRYK